LEAAKGQSLCPAQVPFPGLRRTLGRASAHPGCAEVGRLPLAAGANMTLVVSDSDDTDAALPLRLVSALTLAPAAGSGPAAAPAGAVGAAAPAASGVGGAAPAPPGFGAVAVALQGQRPGP